jgi:hypothetical protein
MVNLLQHYEHDPATPLARRPIPAWARAESELVQDVDAAFAAGASFAILDACMRSEAPFAGLWRNRLALGAATAHVQMVGRRESEGELRDGLALRLAGETADGPAGGILNAWRLLPSRSTGIDALALEKVAALFGLRVGADLGDILKVAETAMREKRSPLHAAAHVLAYVRQHHAPAEFLGFWIADAVLAQRLRWPVPLPLLVTGLAQQGGRRSRARGDEFGRLMRAYARAAAAAVDLFGELQRRAMELMRVAPQLRAKGADAVINALFDEDAVAPASRLGGMSDRGMRRLCDRLVALGAVRELTGRPTFRLYGL